MRRMRNGLPEHNTSGRFFVGLSTSQLSPHLGLLHLGLARIRG